MILHFSWKNVWRSKRRSLIIVAAIALGLWGGLFATGIADGMVEAMVNSAIDRQLTHIQIHQRGFREDRLLGENIPNPDSVLDFCKHLPGVFAVTGRTLVDGMASSATTSQGVEITGVIPSEEETATSIKREIVEGSYLDSGKTGTTVIGKKLADKLKLRLHSKLVLAFQSPDGTIQYAAFRIIGIFQTASTQYDEMTVYVSQTDLFRFLGSPMIHEIAVRMKSDTAVASAIAMLKQRFPSLDVESWRELAPELELAADSTDISMDIFMGVILFALLFGITNTMLMSVMDRVREFGMLMAIGMKRRQVFSMVMIETIFLSLTGGLVGMILGALTVLYSNHSGIDLSVFSQGLSYYGISSLLYPTVSSGTYIVVTVMIIATSILAAVYPAVKAIQLRPVTAMRTYG
jgi:ABC-type lipoprotein release transport system permease subunit